MSADDVAILAKTVEAFLPALSLDGCFDQAAVKTTLETMHDIELTAEAGDPAEDVLWTNAYNGC